VPKVKRERQPEKRINTMNGKTMKQVTKDNREWFQEWANEYDNTLGKVKRHHKLLDLIVNLSGIKTNDQILDIGCGTGLLSLKFLNKQIAQSRQLTAHLRCVRYSKKRLKSAF